MYLERQSVFSARNVRSVGIPEHRRPGGAQIAVTHLSSALRASCSRLFVQSACDLPSPFITEEAAMGEALRGRDGCQMRVSLPAVAPFRGEENVKVLVNEVNDA